jgi:hypothetical protein
MMVKWRLRRCIQSAHNRSMRMGAFDGPSGKGYYLPLWHFCALLSAAGLIAIAV